MKSQELSLLYVFDAIMTETSISRAAERLSMTQPAVSNAVAKMRHHWNDPVFTKKGRNIEPTSFALNLWRQVQAPMFDLSNALDARNFIARESKRKFRIALTDIMLDLIWPPLAAYLAEHSPNIDVFAVPFTMESAANSLRQANVDLSVGLISDPDSSIHSTWLFDSEYVCVMSKQHPLAKTGALDMNAFVKAKHLMVSLSGDATGFTDHELSKLGLERRVAMTVNHFASIPNILSETELIAVVPRIAVGNPGYAEKLTLVEPPMNIETTSIYLAWHARHDKDPAMSWMRKLLVNIIHQAWGKCGHCTRAP